MKKLKNFFYLTIIIIIISGILLWTSPFLLQNHSVSHLSQKLQQHQGLWMIWRYLLYGVIIFTWPYAIWFLGKRQQWPPETIAYLTKKRFALLIFFLLVELLFIYNILSHLLAIFF